MNSIVLSTLFPSIYSATEHFNELQHAQAEVEPHVGAEVAKDGGEVEGDVPHAVHPHHRLQEQPHLPVQVSVLRHDLGDGGGPN